MSFSSIGGSGRAPAIQVITWEVANGAQLKEQVLEGVGPFLDLAQNGATILTLASSSRPVAEAWELATGEKKVLEGHGRVVSAGAVSPDGTLIATVGGHPDPRIVERPFMIVWEFPSGKKLWARDMEAGRYPLEFSPDGKSLVVGGPKGSFIFDVKNNKSTTLRDLRASPRRDGFRFSPNSKFIAYNIGAVGIWSVEQERLVAKLTDGAENPGDVIFGHPGFSRDGRFFVSAEPRVIRVWELPKLD